MSNHIFTNTKAYECKYICTLVLSQFMFLIVYSRPVHVSSHGTYNKGDITPVHVSSHGTYNKGDITPDHVSSHGTYHKGDIIPVHVSSHGTY